MNQRIVPITILITFTEGKGKTRNKQDQFIISMGSIHSEDNTVLNLYVSNNITLKYNNKKFTELKREVLQIHHYKVMTLLYLFQQLLEQIDNKFKSIYLTDLEQLLFAARFPPQMQEKVSAFSV